MNPPCPKCGSLSVKNGGGKYTDGSKAIRYKCTNPDCRSSWTGEKRKSMPSGLPCHYCGVTTIKAGFKIRVDGTRIQKYRCKECDREFQRNMTIEQINWY